MSIDVRRDHAEYHKRQGFKKAALLDCTVEHSKITVVEDPQCAHRRKTTNYNDKKESLTKQIKQTVSRMDRETDSLRQTDRQTDLQFLIEMN